MRIIYALLLILCTLHANASWEANCEQLGYRPSVITQTITNIQNNIAKSNWNTLSKHIIYPLQVNTSPGIFYLIPNQRSFLAYAPLLFNKEVQTLMNQKKEQNIFCNMQGIMLGKGIVWFHYDQAKALMKINTFNPPKSSLPQPSGTQVSSRK